MNSSAIHKWSEKPYEKFVKKKPQLPCESCGFVAESAKLPDERIYGKLNIVVG